MVRANFTGLDVSPDGSRLVVSTLTAPKFEVWAIERLAPQKVRNSSRYRTGCYTRSMDADDRLPPDAVIEGLKREVDRTLLRENLKLTPEQRLMKLQDFVWFTYELGEAGRVARSRPKT